MALFWRKEKIMPKRRKKMGRVRLALIDPYCALSTCALVRRCRLYGGAADEAGVFVHGQARRFDVAV